VSGEPVGRQNLEPDGEIRFLGLPAMPDSLDANQKNTIGDLIRGTSVRGIRALRSFSAPVGEMLNEVLDLLAEGFAQGLRTAEVDGVGFHQIRIELVLSSTRVPARNGAASAKPWSMLLFEMHRRSLPYSNPLGAVDSRP
jgi:hypothetical protein